MDRVSINKVIAAFNSSQISTSFTQFAVIDNGQIAGTGKTAGLRIGSWQFSSLKRFRWLFKVEGFDGFLLGGNGRLPIETCKKRVIKESNEHRIVPPEVFNSNGKKNKIIQPRYPQRHKCRCPGTQALLLVAEQEGIEYDDHNIGGGECRYRQSPDNFLWNLYRYQAKI